MILALITISILLSVFRALGFKSQSYQAIAHLFVGGLIGSYIASRRSYLLYLTFGLSIVEIICFSVFRKKNEQRQPSEDVP